ncbi:uncharacterized protein LOC132313959 [Cornus florida]|uniref:uncharacterized protein LOC132313959 n=1 Tax=Cornus florida TaxID=4283 RepID=UPI00289E5BB4|nr:uncharacterized protein LOC132313959 [Cornus florida]
MDRYLFPLDPSTENPKCIRRPRWKRALMELNGKFEPKYRHDMSHLLMQSYSEIGAFGHSYHIDGLPCQTHMSLITNAGFMDNPAPLRKEGVSALEFDNKGIYLASVTKLGCLMVHDFETLYCHGTKLSTCNKVLTFSYVLLKFKLLSFFFAHPVNSKYPVGLKEDETKHLLHISTHQQLDVVRWNSANQDEVACTSTKSSEVHIFDIGYVSSEPVEVLRMRPTVSVHGCDVHKVLSDIAFSLTDKSRLYASDTHGVINVWDRRISDLPCLGLTTNCNSTINSIQLNMENQIIAGASKNGIIYMWDLRGGRSSAAFQSHKEVYNYPLTSVKLASMLEKIWSLKAQSNIVSKEIHSISVNPSCPYQLAFHLDDGWSGVLDIHNLQVTHIHCPPPSWLDGLNDSSNLSYLRKPSWLPINSIYAAGSSTHNGIHLLDFYPDSTSPCHVDYIEDMQSIPGEKSQHKQNRFIPLSESVTACATHPLNGTIIAGTKQSSLLMISQRQESC